MPGYAWVDLSDEELLDKRIRSLGLTLEGSGLEPLIQRLYDELAAKGLAFLPPIHVGDEWFVPEGIPAVFVPFFLVHDRLRRLERNLILDVEGETDDWFMQLIRHECGHAYSYAYRLYRKRRWQEAFGLASTEENESYRPQPYSRAFVVNLDDWYAQSHPDEDFAETFAVWLQPDSDWRNEYEGWGALRKLEVVDALMAEIAGKPPAHDPQYKPSDYDCLTQKLRTYYAKKRKQWEDAYPDFYDNDLRRLFAADETTEGAVKASRWLRDRRRTLLDALFRWTNERKYRVNGILSQLIERCDELGLRAHPDDARLPVEVACYVATLVTNHLFTGKFIRTK